MPSSDSTGGLRFKVTIDAERTSEEFKEARREVNARLKKGMQTAGEKVVLPESRRRAGGLKVAKKSVASSLVIKAGARKAVLTTNLRGTKKAAVALLEFGGTRRDPLFPRKKKALKLPDGRVVASVRTPRHYEPHHFMIGAVNAKRVRTEETIRDEVLKAFDGINDG